MMTHLRPRFFSALVVALLACQSVSAAAPPKEGMWLPLLISQNMAEMKDMGLKLSAEDIYSVNQSSLKDAVVSLGGGFCTGEIISDQGLLLTNHHCGYDALQQLSVENDADYIKDGFWSRSQAEEKPVEGLFVSFLHRIEDVTDSVLADVKPDDPEQVRSQKVQMRMRRITKRLSEDGKYRVDVKPMFFGDSYYAFIYRDFHDIRLVGAPPESIGKFGGDTDNWMWPRHTGDFSMFRVYADENNQPTDTFDVNNVPYKPKHHFPISLSGFKAGDFNMIMGYPGGTDRYLTSYDIRQRYELSNPTRVKLRRKRLDIMKKFMNQDKQVRIKYQSKYAQVANYWKYFKGQSRGFRKQNTINRFEEKEERFQQWAAAEPKRMNKYGEVLDNLRVAYDDFRPYQIPSTYLGEGIIGVEMFSLALDFRQLHSLLESFEEKDEIGEEEKKQLKEAVKSAREAAKEHFKNYHKPIDRNIFAAMMKMYAKDVDQRFWPEVFQDYYDRWGEKGKYTKFSEKIFKKSFLDDKEEVMEFLDDPDYKDLHKDEGFELFNGFLTAYIEKIVGEGVRPFRQAKQKNSRLYVQGMKEMQPNRNFYPDANSTMRLTYGKVKPYEPRDAVDYDYYTTMGGILGKYKPGDDEFDVPKKLRKIYKEQDFGRYAREDGRMPVCFIGTTDITGGNSGSPVINAEGELIGTAFDGNWEAMTSDIQVEPSITRTINVDIRYTLLVIDKFAGARRLIQEMDIVK